MNNIILHIGTNKTGTSSLQVFLREDKDFLKKNKFIHPNFKGGIGHHHELATCLSKANSIYEPELHTQKAQFYINEINKIFKSNPNHTIILSSEAFHEHSNPSGLKKLLKNYNVKVFCYFREHVSYLSSWYQQNIKETNETRSFTEWLDSRYIRNHTNYVEVLKQWSNSFGKNFKYRPFERESLVGGDIVSDFCDFIGVDAPKVKKTYSNNPSISGNFLFIKKCLNEHISLKEGEEITESISEICEYYDDWHLLFGSQRHKSRSFFGKLHLTEKEISYTHDLYKKHIKILESEFNLKLTLSTTLNDIKFPDKMHLKEDFELIIKECERSQPKLLKYFSRMNINDYIRD